MRNIFPRCASLLLSLLIMAGGMAPSVGALASVGNAKAAKTSPGAQQPDDYAATLKKHAEEAAKVRARLEKIRARAAELRARTRKEKSQNESVKFSFSSADEKKGIAGSVADKVSGVTLLFESKRQGDALTTRIWNHAGTTQIEYVEAERALVTDPSTGAQSYEPVPALRFGGVDVKELKGPLAEAMGRFANSTEGDLLRKLALYIVEYTPGEDIETERRGLEVPYQAMQTLYATPAIEEYGGGELKAARHYGAKRLAETKDAPPRRPHEPLVAQPVDCEKFQCVYADSHDYQLSGEGGYVVKSLSPRLSLSHNFAPPEVRGADGHHDDAAAAAKAKGLERKRTDCPDYKIVRAGATRARAPRKPAPRRRDDASQVGDCFGRCGGGCGGWTHEWVGEPTVVANYTYCEPPEWSNRFGVDCSMICCSLEKQYVSFAGTAVHTAHGKVTFGSIAHDSCVRALGWPAWLSSLPGMPCFPELLLAADCAIPGVGSDQTWSYIGPHTEVFNYFTENCCTTLGGPVY
jgi:hypothetical protein